MASNTYIGGTLLPQLTETSTSQTAVTSSSRTALSGETGSETGIIPVKVRTCSDRSNFGPDGMLREHEAYLTRDTWAAAKALEEATNKRLDEVRARGTALNATPEERAAYDALDSYKQPGKKFELHMNEAYRNDADAEAMRRGPYAANAAKAGSISWHQTGRAWDDAEFKKLPLPVKSLILAECPKLGISRLPGEGEDQHFYVMGPFKGKGAAAAYQAVKGDIDAIASNEAKGQRNTDYTAANSTQPCAASTTGVAGSDPAGAGAGAGGMGQYGGAGTNGGGVAVPGGMLQGSTLDYATTGGPTTRLDIKKLPTNKDQWDEVKAQFENDKKRFGRDSKLEKNKYPKKLPIGFESKIGTPAQIRITLDAVTGNDTERSRAKAAGLNVFDKYDAWKNSGNAYIDCFILRQAEARRQEKYFIFDSLGEYNTTFFFGNRPETWSFSGTLIDTYNQQWFNDFSFYYDEYLRGTAAVRNRSRIFIIFSDQLVEGFITDCSLSKVAEANDQWGFSFNMVMIQRTTVGAEYIDPVKRVLLDSKTQAVNNKVTDQQAYEGAKTPEQANIEHAQQLLNQAAGAAMNYVKPYSWMTRLLAPPGVDTDALTNMLPESKAKKEAQAASPQPAPPAMVRNQVALAATNPGTVLANSLTVDNMIDMGSSFADRVSDILFAPDPPQVDPATVTATTAAPKTPS